MHNALQKQCMDKRGLIGRVYRRHFQLNAKVYFNDVFLKRRGYVLYNECIRSHFEKKQKYYFSFIFTIPPPPPFLLLVNENLNTTPPPR